MKVVDELRLVQLLCLKCLVDTANACNKLDISYYLIAGTLLGAIRNKGFIPWDSDIDIGLLREDYDNFIKNVPKLLNDEYFIQNDLSDPLNKTFFTKVRIQGTKFLEKRNKTMGGKNGIYIDVFPIDDIKEHPTIFKFYFLKLIRILTRVKAFKNGKRFSSSLTKSIVSFILCCLFSWIPIKWLNTLIEKYYRRGNGKDYQLVTNYNSKYGIIKQTMSKSIYGAPQMIEFEKHIFNIPQKHTIWLKHIYGNFMDPPSKIPKRTQMVNLYNVNFGKYENLLGKSEDFVRETLGI